MCGPLRVPEDEEVPGLCAGAAQQGEARLCGVNTETHPEYTQTRAHTHTHTHTHAHTRALGGSFRRCESSRLPQPLSEGHRQAPAHV